MAHVPELTRDATGSARTATRETAEPWTDRRVALLGVATVAAAVAQIAVNVNVPGAATGAADVSAYFRAHSTAVQVASYLGLFSAVLLVGFVAFLRQTLAAAAAPRMLLATLLAGGILLAAGILFSACVNLAAASAAQYHHATASQALSILVDKGFLLNTGGMALFMLSAALIVRRAATPLPTWLVWAAFVPGLIALGGPIGPIAAPLTVLWVLAASIALLLGSRSRRREPQGVR